MTSDPATPDPSPDPRPSDPSSSPNGPKAAEPAERFPPGLRIALYFLTVMVLVLETGTIALFFWLHGVPEPPPPPGEPLQIAIGWRLALRALMAPTIIVATIGFLHFVDRKPVQTIGIGFPADRRLWSVSLLAVVGVGLWAAAMSFLGFLDISYDPSTRAPGVELLLFAGGIFAAACVDEWTFRGYIFSTLRERFSWAHAAGLSGVLFALQHTANPDIEVSALLNMFLLGLILAAIREFTGSLWPCVLFYGLWNFLIGCVLSLPVSGFELPNIFQSEAAGPEIWTGGAYGPEASWLTVGALLVLLLALSPNLLEEEEDDEEGSSDGRDDSAGRRSADE